MRLEGVVISQERAQEIFDMDIRAMCMFFWVRSATEGWIIKQGGFQVLNDRYGVVGVANILPAYTVHEMIIQMLPRQITHQKKEWWLVIEPWIQGNGWSAGYRNEIQTAFFFEWETLQDAVAALVVHMKGIGLLLC